MKKRIFLLALAFVLFLPLGIVLTACGSNNNNTPQTKSIMNIEIFYNGNTYNFTPDENQNIVLPYSENMHLSAQDFSVRVSYYEENVQPDIISSDDPDLEFDMYLHRWDSALDQYVKEHPDPLVPGYYNIEYRYKEWPGFFSFEVAHYSLEDERFNVQYQRDNVYRYDETDPTVALPVEPEVTVTFDGRVLQEYNEQTGEGDYTICYINSTVISSDSLQDYEKPYFIIDGTGKYEGTKTYYYNISCAQIAQVAPVSDTISVDYSENADHTNLILENLPIDRLPAGFYTGQMKFKVYDSEHALIYSNYDNVGNATSAVLNNAGTYYVEYVLSEMLISGFGYAYDNPVATLTVNPIDISNWAYNDMNREFKASAFTSIDFNSQDINLHTGSEACVEIGLIYTISMIEDGTEVRDGVYADNTNVSNALRVGAIQVTAIGPNYTGSMIIEYSITPVDIQNGDFAVAVVDQDIEYDGQEHHPTLSQATVMVNSNPYNLSSSDYELSYSEDCTTAGQKTITITAKSNSNFTGEKSINFYITKKIINVAAATQDWSNSISNPINLTYNGQDQLPSIAIPAIEGIDITYTIKAYEDVEGSSNRKEVTFTELKLGRSYYEDYYRVYPSFEFTKANEGKDGYGNAYADNYEIVLPINNLEKWVLIHPLEVTSIDFTDATKASFDGTNERYEKEYPFYTYDGTAKTPQLVVMTSLSQAPLTSGQDYVVGYANGWQDLEEVINVGQAYYAYPDFSIAGGYQNYSYSGAPLYFDINKATLSSAQITQITNNYPSVEKYVWGYRAYFDLSTNSTRIENQTVAGIVGDFVIEDTEVNSSNQVEVSFISQNYEAISAFVTASLVSPFSFFKVNDVTLSAAEIDELDSLVLGDRLDIAFSNDYQIRYIDNNQDYYNYYQSTTGFSKIIGTDKNYTDNYLYETSATISLLPAGDDDYYSTIIKRSVEIDRNIFSRIAELQPDNSVQSNYLNNGVFEIPSWSIGYGNKLVISLEEIDSDNPVLAQSDYVLNYHEQYSSGSWTYNDTYVRSLEYTNTDAISRLIVHVYNNNNPRDQILNLYYYFDTSMVVTLDMGPKVEFVFGADTNLKSVTALNEEGNYVLDSNGYERFSLGNYIRPYETFYQFMNCMHDYGYDLLNNKITLTTSNVPYLPILCNTANDAADMIFGGDANIIVEGYPSIDTQSIITRLTDYYMGQYTADEIENMSHSELMNLLIASETETHEIRNQDVKELMVFYRKYHMYMYKIGYVQSQIEDQQPQLYADLTDKINEINSYYYDIQDLYAYHYVSSYSPVLLTKAYNVDLKKALLTALKAGDDEEAENIEARIEQANSLLSTTAASVINDIQTKVQALYTGFTEVDALMADTIAGFTSAQMEGLRDRLHSAEAYMSAEEFSYDLTSTTPLLNLWTGAGLNADGGAIYYYYDASSNLTYSFRAAFGDEYLVVYIFNGEVEEANMDGTSPTAAYKYTKDITDNNGTLSVLNYDSTVFEVVGGSVTGIQVA